MNISNKRLKSLLNLDLLVASISLITLIIITFFGVLMRYIFNNPFVWQQEVQLWCFVWVVFFGSSAAFRSESHVAIEVLVDRMPLAMRKIVNIFIYIVVISVLSYFMIHGTNLIKQLIRTSRTTNILDIPYQVIYSAFPIGCGLMIINYTIIMIMRLFSKNVNEQGGE